jgi:hypothetical protein
MKRYASLAALAGLLFWVGAALAQEAVTIKLKDKAEGAAYQVEKNESGTVTTKVTVMGQNKEDTKKLSETTAYKETVLKLDDKKHATKLEREYTKAEKTTDGKAEKSPLSGKTVVIEKKGDKFTFTFKDGGEVEGEAAEGLNKEFNKNAHDDDLDKLLLPTKAVKPGDEWKIDMKAVAQYFSAGEDLDVDGDKATGTGKLLKVYKKDGKQFGEIMVKLEMPVKSLGKGNMKIDAEKGSKVVLSGTMDVCIDGSASTGSLKAKMLMDVSAMPPGASVTLKVDVDSQTAQTELKK